MKNKRTKNNALLNRLKRKGKVKTVSGGRTIVQELEYAENGTYKRYSGYEVLNISPSDVFTGAEYNYAQSAVAVSISGLEMIQNSGEEAIIDLLESRIANAEKLLAQMGEKAKKDAEFNRLIAEGDVFCIGIGADGDVARARGVECECTGAVGVEGECTVGGGVGD